MKVLVLENYMGPNSFPVLRALAKEKDLDLEVFYLSFMAKSRRWKDAFDDLGFKYRVLPNFQINFFEKDLFTYIINPTFIFDLIKGNYDVIISDGWQDLSNQLAFFLCKIFGKKFIIWSESTFNEPSWRRSLTLPLVKTIVSNSDAWLVKGSFSKKYLSSLGAKSQKTFISPGIVDVDFFRSHSKLSFDQKNKLKEKLKIKKESLVILYSGQLLKRKGVNYLIRAFATLQRRYKNVFLLIQGYGPEKDNLVKLCNNLKTDRVIFSDHLDWKVIPKIYGISDIFVLPSFEETWGRVINEAMACGLPIITTRKVGGQDLIKEGINGFIVKEKNVLSLKKVLEKLIKENELRKKMGENSFLLSKKFFTPEMAARGIIKAINSVNN